MLRKIAGTEIVARSTELDEGYAKTHGHSTARDLVKMIAMDIGKEVCAYIEVQYPEAVAAASSTFLLSVRGCVYNEIMASLEVTEGNAIRLRLSNRKKFRRAWKAAWKKLHARNPRKLQSET